MEGFFPTEVFRLFGIPVRDTVVSTWIMMTVIIAVVLLLRRRFPILLEKLIVFLSNTISDTMDRPAHAYLPFLGTLLIFIAVANILSILPTIPLPNNRMLPITSPTKDINTPAALAITVFFAVHVFGIREKGVWRYFKDLASPIYLAPLTLPLEVFGQISRTLSLTLRLFGNVVSGEMVVAVIASLVPVIAPLPLTGLSMITGILQAYIFTSLAIVFVGAAVQANE
jgi:F-type H+-transporting ATPase subunit a